MTTTETIFGPIVWDYVDSDIIGQGVLLRGLWRDHENGVQIAGILLSEKQDEFHLRDWPLYDWAPRVRPGWYRKVPCSPLVCGDHGWHLYEAQSPGSGAFRALYVDWLYRDSDKARRSA